MQMLKSAHVAKCISWTSIVQMGVVLHIALCECKVTMFNCCNVAMLQSGNVEMLQCCKVAMLQTCKVAKLQSCKVAMLQVSKLQSCKIAILQNCKVAMFQCWKVAKLQCCKVEKVKCCKVAMLQTSGHLLVDNYWYNLLSFGRNPCRPSNNGLSLKVNELIMILAKSHARSQTLAFVFIFALKGPNSVFIVFFPPAY